MKTLHRLLANRSLALGLLVISVFVMMAILAPVLAPPDNPDDPTPTRVVGAPSDRQPYPPSDEARLGTVPGQLDVYYTLVWGSRSALKFGFTVALAAALVGVTVGAIAGYVGGLPNGAAMRVTDAFLTFPVIAGIWLLSQLIPPPGMADEAMLSQNLLAKLQIGPVMLALIIFSWMPYARLTNVNIIQLKQSDFVAAARAVGVSNPRILRRHLLPNALAPAIVLIARDVAGVVLLESAFSFIGTRSETDWGQILVASRDWVLGIGGNPLQYWWTFVPISLALIFFGIGWNLIGDGLNDQLNPRSTYRAG